MKTFIKVTVLLFIAITISYSQVTQQWVQTFTSDSLRTETVNDMFVDAQGNVYVTGSQRGSGSLYSTQAATIKYNSQGVQQWIQPVERQGGVSY